MISTCLIGAGQLGSRHLQALKSVSTALDITVVDPSEESLKVAQERYEAVPGAANHTIKYEQDLTNIGISFDVVIVATNSDKRREVMEKLLSRATVKYFVLEKMLFQRLKDYEAIDKLLKKNRSKAWINCSMRTMPLYRNLKESMSAPINYFSSGSGFGLITTSIHYIDHMAHITGCYDFELILEGLKPNPVPSKRPGYLEFNGTLAVTFKDGSFGAFTCFAEGDLPVHVEVHSSKGHYISRENEQKAWIASAENNWKGQDVDAPIPYQSQLTTEVVEDILKTGDCGLTTYEQSTKLHITLLEGILSFLNKHSEEQFDFYPFT